MGSGHLKAWYKDTNILSSSLFYTSEVSPQHFRIIIPLIRVRVCFVMVLHNTYIYHCSISGHAHTHTHTHTIYSHTHSSLGPKRTCYPASKALREQLLLRSASSSLRWMCECHRRVTSQLSARPRPRHLSTSPSSTSLPACSKAITRLLRRDKRV